MINQKIFGEKNLNELLEDERLCLKPNEKENDFLTTIL